MSKEVQTSIFKPWTKVGSAKMSRSGKVIIIEVEGSKYFMYTDALIDLTADYAEWADVFK